jgi:hypothetical protein
MNENSKFKLGIMLWLIALVLSFAVSLYKTENSNTTELDSAPANQVTTSPSPENLNELKVVLAPTPFIKQQGKVKGESSPVKFEKDFETSLKIQELPKIWLEFTDADNQTIIVDIPKQAEEFIQKRWITTFEHSYKNQSTSDRSIKLEINRDYLTDAVVFAQKLQKFEIKTPLEKRNISLEEGFEIMKVVAKLSIERYEELQKMASQVNPQKISERNF